VLGARCCPRIATPPSCTCNVQCSSHYQCTTFFPLRNDSSIILLPLMRFGKIIIIRDNNKEYIEPHFGTLPRFRKCTAWLSHQHYQRWWLGFRGWPAGSLELHPWYTCSSSSRIELPQLESQLESARAARPAEGSRGQAQGVAPMDVVFRSTIEQGREHVAVDEVSLTPCYDVPLSLPARTGSRICGEFGPRLREGCPMGAPQLDWSQADHVMTAAFRAIDASSSAARFLTGGVCQGTSLWPVFG